MKHLDFDQNTPEWEAHRATARNASEAPAMMGASKNMKRNELIQAKATGTEKEFSDYVQNHVFAEGHETEALARPIVEKIFGLDLYPVTGVDDEGDSASYDGLTMDETTSWEHKQWNEELAERVRNKDLGPEHYWQLEHQLKVNPEIEKVIFTVSDGTEDNMVHMEYTRVEGRRKELMLGWEQFDKDVKNYVEVVDAPKAIAKTAVELPSVMVKVNGQLTLESNLPEFKVELDRFIDNLVLEPETDQEFADAELAVKIFEKAEKALDAAEENALAQVAVIGQMVKLKQAIRATARDNRLKLDSAVKTQKTKVKTKIRTDAVKAFDKVIAELNEEFAPIKMPEIPTDFAAAVKNKRTMASLRDAVDTALAKAKIEANEIARVIRKNKQLLHEKALDHKFLFTDAQQIIQKDHDDMVLLIESRIKKYNDEQAEKKAAEDKRIADEAVVKAAEEAGTEGDVAEPATENQERDTASSPENSQTISKSGENVYTPPVESAPADYGYSATAPATGKVGGHFALPSDKEVIGILKGHYGINAITALKIIDKFDTKNAHAEIVGGNW